MVKYIIFILISMNILFADKSKNEFADGSCFKNEKLLEWEKINKENPESFAFQSLHALWMGLCAKVQRNDLSADLAKVIFDRIRMIALVKIHKGAPKEEQRKELEL